MVAIWYSGSHFKLWSMLPWTRPTVAETPPGAALSITLLPKTAIPAASKTARAGAGREEGASRSPTDTAA
jgi:hypothetical protein